MKILYGLISDNIPIFGSRRKSYLFILSLINFVSLNVVANYAEDYNIATFCLFMSSFSVAFSDVIVDSLMVIQSRRRPKDGSELLQGWCWFWCSVGGFSGSITAAYLVERYDPTVSFQICSIVGLITIVFAYRLDVSVEKEGLSDDEKPKPLM